MKLIDNENISKTKRLILAISETLFAEKGFDKTGVNEIAEKAGIAKSVIYHHFKNKDDILQMLVQSLSDELAELKRSIKGKWPEDMDKAIDMTLEELLAFWETHSRIAVIIMSESLKDTTEVPLFTLWDNIINEPISNLKMNSNPSQNQIMEIITETFFMMFLPTYSYAIFAEKWCRHFNFATAESRQSFLALVTDICKSKIRMKEKLN